MHLFEFSVSNLRSAPRKAVQVCDLIRGKKVEEALSILFFLRKKVARDLALLLRSALDGVRNVSAFSSDGFYVYKISVGHGSVMKRILHRARGTATPILKRKCHISIVLAKR